MTVAALQSDSALFDSLRRLQLMELSVETLKVWIGCVLSLIIGTYSS